MLKLAHANGGGEDMREIFVCSMLLMAGIDDMKRNRISNCIVIPAIILSVIYKVYFDGFC